MFNTLDTLLNDYLLVSESLAKTIPGTMSHKAISNNLQKLGDEIDRRLHELTKNIDITAYE